ncbi:MAG: Obg family GTPase CgtA [Patescibacteria group bacterium]
MAFVDELDIDASAGKGGDGVVRWLHLKGKEYSGPAGGNGGNGGDILIRGVRDIALLGRYRGEKSFKAGDGQDGQSYSMEGKQGKDLVIDLPVGSLVHNEHTGEEFELLAEDETKLILKGGRGGAGNEAFKSSVNTSPTECTPGAKGEGAHLHIELRLIADAGFVGLPNAGKTSLLNALTNASAKVGSYAFTTLDPNLGVIPGGYILADIPGLIEGASGGKGLGSKFLRHVARTRELIHCVSLESDAPLDDYRVVRGELEQFSAELANKPELVVLTKSDTREPLYIEGIRQEFKKVGGEPQVVSVLDDESLKALRDRISAVL